MWHVTCDTWRLICDKWGEVNILSVSQLSSFYGFWLKVCWKYFHKGSLTDWINEWIINGGHKKKNCLTNILLIIWNQAKLHKSFKNKNHKNLTSHKVIRADLLDLDLDYDYDFEDIFRFCNISV